MSPPGHLPEAAMRSESMPQTAARARGGRYIYIACPWAPKGGGMFKVADYLIQAQACTTPGEAAELRALDTRGGAHAVFSVWVLATALAKLVRGRFNGQLAGVHVNMAERLSLFRKSAIVVMSRALGVPVVLHLHAAQMPNFFRSLPLPVQALTRWVFSLPASCVVLGAVAQRFVIDELRVPANRVEVVINGVPEPTQTRRKTVADAVQRVLFVGNLSERKGVSDLLQALALPGFEASRLEVTLAGGGDLESYRTKARQLGVDGFVRFAGWADQAQVAHLMARADVLVLPAYDEGLPLVILEALANGVAVVCTPVGEIPSVLTDGVNACFVQPGDVASIAAGLQRVLRQPAFREALERNGRALYVQQFSLTRFFTNIARIHQRCFGIAGQPLRSHNAAEQRLP
jgi:glycosyltransferase involved in cell wall biosynthesis